MKYLTSKDMDANLGKVFGAHDLKIHGDDNAKTMYEDWKSAMTLRKREQKLAAKVKFETLDEAGKQKHCTAIPGVLRREFTKRCRESKITPK